MIVLEMKAVISPHQQNAIDDAIRTVQFIRNKALRLWMDAKREDKIDKYALNKYCRILAKEYSFADELNSTARQSASERAWSAISRFYDNCKKGIKGKKGFPKFQKNNRSVEYKQSGWKLSADRKKITFTDKKRIGTVKLKGTRDLNFYPIDQIKRVRIVRRADGYYIQFCLNVDIRNYTKPLEPTKHCTGIDVGLKYFYADSDGNTVEIPQYYRQAEKRLNRLNRRKSKKFQKGQRQSNNYQKARKRYALKHLRVSRQRKGFVCGEALRVIKSNDFVAYEDLNVKGMVKSKLAKSINDAAWSTFRQWLEYFGFKYGKVTVAVPPHNTSQNCSNCGEKVKKSLSTRTHICPHCGYVEDRDINAAINILKKGLSTVGHTGTKAWGDLPSGLVGEILPGDGESMNQESLASREGSVKQSSTEPTLAVEVNVQDAYALNFPDFNPEIKLDTWENWFSNWLVTLRDELPVANAYELTLRLTDDVEMQALNAQYRQKDQPTDVLAFAALEVDVPELSATELTSEPLYLGDLVISIDTASRQAQQQGHSLTTELAWLAAHGLLHLVGWDHPDEASLKKMLSQQETLLKLIGLDPQNQLFYGYD